MTSFIACSYNRMVVLKYCILFFVCSGFNSSAFNRQSWAGVTINCRDNDGQPVDWWFMYKPPMGVGNLRDDGRNFSYITSEENGRWQASRITITRHSMLQRTLAPLYRKTYRDHMGAAIYRDDDTSDGTGTYGVVMTDVIGGLWLAHTVPGFPYIYDRAVIFPEKELENGHLMVCVSVDVDNAGRILKELYKARPNIDHHFVSHLFLDWNQALRSKDQSLAITTASINTRQGQPLLILTRPPGSKRCIYRKFAQDHSIVLDVYGQSAGPYLYTICSDKYSLRNIESISIKLSNEVFYIQNKTDRSRWAVSTSHFQRRSGSNASYWTCVCNLDKQDHTPKGGIMICMEHFGVWRAFDNLKIAEPECYQ